MAQSTKKQHYVPQFYLSAWSTPGNHQIYVYDKISEKPRVNNIEDVASERYFYDFNPNEIFSEAYIGKLRKQGIQFNADERFQGIERAFSEEIEAPFSTLSKAIIDKALVATPWTIHNCYFLDEEKKAEFSSYLMFQFIRTKRIRTGIQESAECLAQALTDMGFPPSAVEKYMLSKESAKKIHVQMLLDEKELSEISGLFYSLTWMLGINRTKKKLYTTDSPIGTYGHIKHPFISTNGLNSKGVEVFFPLSPDVILLMVDGTYHKHCLPFERRYIEITNEKSIECYNSLLATQARRDIYSFDGDFSLLTQMKTRDTEILNYPHVQLSWGDRKYYPKKN